jgi:hypothetical protein
MNVTTTWQPIGIWECNVRYTFILHKNVYIFTPMVHTQEDMLRIERTIREGDHGQGPGMDTETRHYNAQLLMWAQ